MLVLCVAQCVSVSFLNSGCRRSDEESTPSYFTLAPCDIVKYQRSALLSGDGEAAYRLFFHHEFGFVFDEIRGTYWLRKSGELGHEDALHTLAARGFEYPNSNHVTRLAYFDLTSRDVAKYRRKALEDGDGEAAYRLCLYYQVECVNDARAIYWLRKSGGLGYGEALHELNLMGIKLDKPKQKFWDKWLLGP